MDYCNVSTNLKILSVYTAVANVWKGGGKSRVTGCVLALPSRAAQVDTFFKF